MSNAFQTGNSKMSVIKKMGHTFQDSAPIVKTSGNASEKNYALMMNPASTDMRNTF